MKRCFLFSILFLFCYSVNSQIFDGYEYVVVNDLEYKDGRKDIWGISRKAKQLFSDKGLTVINSSQVDGIKNKCKILTLNITHTNVIPPQYGYNYVYYKFYNCLGKEFRNYSGRAQKMTLAGDYRAASDKANKSLIASGFKTYNLNPNKTPKYISNVKKYTGSEINFNDESSIRDFLLSKSNDEIEGLWSYMSSGNSEYKLLILKDSYNYNAYIVEGSGFWEPSELKAVFEPSAVPTVFSIKWTLGDKKTETKSVATVKPGIINFNLSNPSNNSNSEALLYKLFPPLGNNIKSVKNSVNNKWAGNGSGLIISKSGYIITNHHVVKDANEIEVEFILNDETQKFNAEIVQLDKTNDLAVIKIFDMNFDGLDNLTYNFKTRSSDVGTKVYAYGYPMALSLMGKEIKVTDGIISSKSGFDGDITTYQITAPIQGGNSGGPLFDEKGNFLGINSSGLSKNIADNVGYTIKSSYVLNLIDVLPKSIDLPSTNKLESLSLTDQIKEISKYVVLIKVK